MNRTIVLATVLLFGALPTFAQQSAAADQTTQQTRQPDAVATADLTEGELRRVDKEQKKVTIKHGEIKNLDMPPMTMVFAVADPALLDVAKPGDKVRFKAVQRDGKLTITELQLAS